MAKRHHYNDLIKLCAVLILLFLGSCAKEVSVSPPDAPPHHGFVFIDSYPKGFHIYLNNRARRRATPDSLTWLTSGSYTITLKKDLYRDTTISVDILEGEKRKYFVDIADNPAMRGSIMCTSTPSSAEILVNDSATGKVTPAEITGLLPGKYTVRYKMKNHRDDSTYTTVSSSHRSSAIMYLVDTTVWRDYNTANSSIPSNYFTCIYIEKNDLMWLGSDGVGLVKFQNGKFDYYSNANTSMPGNTITCITEDKNGTKWVGTNSGLVEFDKTPDVNMMFYNKVNSLLPSVNIKSIACGSKDTVWVATNEGVAITWMETGFRQWKVFDTINHGLNDWYLPENWVTVLEFDLSGIIWAGTKKSGISEFGGPTYNTLNSSIPSNVITSCALAKDGSMWFTNDPDQLNGSGLSHFTGSGFEGVYNLPYGCSTYNIYVDNNNTKWVSTNKGLVRFTEPSATVEYTYQNTGLNIGRPRGVVQDSKGKIWIATYGGGLIEMKKVNN